MGAVQLQSLRSRVNQALADRFGRHQPATKEVPSDYRDSGQISINSLTTIAVSPSSFTNWSNVRIDDSSTVYTSFKPNRAVISQTVSATFVSGASVGYGGYTSGGNAPNTINGVDVLLVAAYSGSLNTFPNAPSDATGIHGHSFAAHAFGVGISWPTVNAGIPFSVSFSVLQTVLYRVVPPTGFTLANLSSLVIGINMALFGPQLR